MQPDAARKIPISLLTGFLGSGKTTLLNHLLQQPAMANVMVIINEFGEIGLDHELVERGTDDMVLLQSGCLCCTVRGDLIETLRSLHARSTAGESPSFNRVVIETTGLADPAPILQALMMDGVVVAYFDLDSVITTVDAVAGEATLDRHIEAVKQAAIADRILLTKTGLASERDCAALEQRLRALNRAAPILRISTGKIEPQRLFGAGLQDPAGRSIDLARWLQDEKYAHHHHDSTHNDVNRHDAHIRAMSLVLEEPVPGETLDAWLRALMQFRGPDLLRFKGIVNVVGMPGPLVLHGVQHVIYPPVALKSWPSDDHRTRMVFISYDIDEKTLRGALDQLTQKTNEPASPG